MSAPAANALPDPVMIIARHFSEFAQNWSAFCSSFNKVAFKAFNLSGLLSVIRHIWPFSSKIIVSKFMSPILDGEKLCLKAQFSIFRRMRICCFQ
jgi:hypothetical protein